MYHSFKWQGNAGCEYKKILLPHQIPCTVPVLSRYSSGVCIKKRFPGRVFRPGNPKRTAATYSPTWWGSTIGACELNFSVRNGKRWDLTAVTAAVCYRERLRTCIRKHGEEKNGKRKGFGLLVRVGFAIADFTPPAYRRGRLPRPSTKSHLGDGFALRCFQRLS